MKKGIIAISFALMLAGVTAHADMTVDKCTYDRDTKIAVVSGTADCDEVTLSIKNGETTFYEAQQTVNNGEYKFDFQLQGEEHTDYSVTVGGMESDPVNGTLAYYGNEVNEIFAKLNSYAEAQNSSAFQELLKDSLDVLGLELSEEEQNAIPYMASALMLQAPFNKVGEMSDAFETAKYLYNISTISEGSVLNDLIKANKARLTTQYPNVYDVYEKFDETKQNAVCDAIIAVINKNVVAEERFNEIFAVQTMRSAIRSAAGWSAAKDLVSKTKSELLITATALTDKSEVYIKMINSDYSEMADFNKVYTQALKDANSTKKPIGGGGGGGSTGGNGGNGGTNVLVPQPPVQETPKTVFKDIANVAWAKEAIEGLAKDKIINGRDEDTFDPNAPVLREEFIKMLVLAFDMDIHEADVRFDDAGSDKWFSEYVNTAKYEGIVSGMGENLFGAGENITRQDMVTITYRAMQKFNLTEDTEAKDEAFADDGEIADYARDGVYYLKNINVINGRENNNFAPRDNISRAEAAKILYSVRNIKTVKDYVTEEKAE